MYWVPIIVVFGLLLAWVFIRVSRKVAGSEGPAAGYPVDHWEKAEGGVDEEEAEGPKT